MFEYGFPKHWTTLKKLIFLSLFLDGSGEQIVWTTVSGTSPLTLTNALAHEIRSLKQYGKVEQFPKTYYDSLTQYGKVEQPYPPTPSAPADIVCNNGALKYSPNLLDPSTSKIVIGEYYVQSGTITPSVNNWRTGLIPVVGGKTYAFWGRAKADNTISAYNRINWFDANGNNIYPRPSYTIDTVTVGTAPSNAAFAGLSCSCYNSAAAITRETFDLFNWEFAETSEEIPYTPYAEGGIYAGGTHPGKNLANVTEQSALVGYYISAQGAVTADPNNWVYQAFIRVKPNTQYTLSMSQSVYYVSISEYSVAADSGFIVRKAGSTGSNTSLTITTEANTNFIRFGTNVDRAAITLEEVLGINWQVEEGATATAYEPYTEIPYQPEVLTVNGQNLVDLTAVTDGYYYDPSGVYTALAVARLTDYIPVKAGQKYTVYVKAEQAGTAANVRCNLFDSAQTWKSQSSFTVNSGSQAVGIITPTENGYLRVSANYSGTGAKADWSTLQIVVGEYTLATMPPYEPYVTPQTVTDIPMLLSMLDGSARDALNLISGHADRAIVAFRVSPDLNWALASGTGYKQFYAPYTQVPLANSVSCMSNVAPYGCTASNRASYQFGCYTGSTGNLCFQMIGETSLSTVADWKAFLRDNVVYVVAIKATATTEQTTPHSLTLDADSVVSIDAPISDIVTLIEAHEHTVPSKDYPLPLWCNNGVIGRSTVNLYDPTAATLGVFIQANGVPKEDANLKTSDYIPVTAGETYTLFYREMGPATRRLHGYDAQESWVQQLAFKLSGRGASGVYDTITVVIPDGISFVRFSENINDDAISFTQGPPREIVTVKGYNLLDTSQNVTGSFISSTGKITAAADAQYTGRIRVEPGETYTWSMVSNRTTAGTNRWHGYNESGNWVQQIAYASSGTGGAPFVLTATIPSGIAFVRLSYGINDTDAMLEKSSTAGEYQPYLYETAIVEDLYAVDAVKDEQDLITGAVSRNTAVCVYDGTQPVGDSYISETGGKDIGAIIVYIPSTTAHEHVAAQPLSTAEGNTTIEAESNVDPVTLEVEYAASA